jgi:xanthine dehydrogenase YagS FAD-binding subunit
MISFPRTFDEAVGQKGVLRAGSTDLSERRHKGLTPGDLIDLRDVATGGIEQILADGSVRIGSLTTLHEVANSPVLIASYPGLVQAAGGLATPQIRARATLGGSLLQEVRCWYYRDSAQLCAKKGGLSCLARAGDARFHAAFDHGPCIAPHPSTMAVALLAFDGLVEVNGDSLRTIPELLGPGTDPTQTHAVADGEVVTAVILPPPVAGEYSSYLRTIHRARAEWPLVEVVVRVSGSPQAMSGVHLAAGGLANRPQSWPELALQADGRALSDATWNTMVDNLAKADLPQAAYKARMLPTTLRDALAKAMAGTPAAATLTPTKAAAEETP